MQYVYPTSQRIMEIERDKLPVLKGDDPIYQHFPEMNVDEWNITWEQLDNISGLQQYRGLNNAPPPIKPQGMRRMTLEPGVYGEHALIDERELTTRRQTGTFGSPIDLTDIMLTRTDQLAEREYSRLRLMMWTLLQTGLYSVVDKYNVTDSQYTFTPQVFTASVPWATVATATPLADFRTLADLGGLGTSTQFDSTAIAYMTQTTLNKLYGNQNAADLGGKKFTYGQTLNGVSEMKNIFIENDLPTIKVIQDGYWDEVTQAFIRYINSGKVVVVGKRPGNAPIGNMVFARNANNPNMAPGRYMRTIDKDLSAMGPRSIELHRGWNGMCLIKYPRSVYIMNV